MRDGEGQGGLACCSPYGVTESDVTERLNSNNRIYELGVKTGRPEGGAVTGRGPMGASRCR